MVVTFMLAVPAEAEATWARRVVSEDARLMLSDIVLLLAGPDSDYVTGLAIKVDGTLVTDG